MRMRNGRHRRWTAVAICGSSLLLGVSLLGAPAASASSAAGPAEVVAPGSTTQLASGGSGTQFGILLPDGARCPGDSTVRPWYRAGSYLVPKGTDPATINFRGLLPDKGQFLVAFGAPWEHHNVVKGSGLVQVPEFFDIQRFQAADFLAPGATRATWEAGVACVDDFRGVAVKYWNVDFTFIASHADPAGFTWTARPSSPLGGSTSQWPVFLGLGGIGVAVIVAAGILRGGFRRRGNDRDLRSHSADRAQSAGAR